MNLPAARPDATTLAPAAPAAVSGRAGRPASGGVPDPAPRTAATVAIARGSAAGRAAWKRAILEPYAAVEADTVEGLRHLLVSRQPAVLLLDAELPGLGGPAGLFELRQLSPQLRAIVLGDFRSDSDELAFFRAGARACCKSDISLVLLARAVDAVLRGEVWIRRALTGSLVTELAALEAACVTAARSPQRPADLPGRVPESLTARERQVAVLLARGDSNQAIARQLSIGEGTVAAYARRIMRKSGAGDRARLALLFGGLGTD